jgi:CYTH domain-containing protein
VLDAPWVHIAQGYLPGEALIERVRRTTQPDGAVACVRTVKLGRGVERVEIEEGISPSLFDGLWALTAPHRVSKRRYRIADAEGAWEVDDFEGLDLVLAERELPAVETPVPIPDWMAPYLVREVTDEAAYTNVQLARRAGLPRQPVGARV